MSSEKTLENVKKLLKEHNQSHLLAFFDQLDAEKRQDLLAQINQLDFTAIDQWIARYIKSKAPHTVPSDFKPAPYYPFPPGDAAEKQKYQEAAALGKELISAGKVAAFVVAGGQGTRLGFDGPKGNFPISPVKNKTLFQLFAETILAACKKYNVVCPWYIMTSPMNFRQTKEILAADNYYGLDEKNVFIFQQGTLPNFSFDGRILMADKDRIACSPDGHGGSLKALYQSGASADMKKRGVEFISYHQVDNPLINIFDPLFIGLHALDNSEMSSKGLVKNAPKEKLGNFCLVDGKITIIEYSDLPDELAEKRNPDGSLAFELGSIGIHIISVSFVEKLNAGGFSLPLHKAVKKIPHIDKTGRLIKPTEPNGVKLESFVFDAVPMASKSIILQTLRQQEFGPVKNASGVDSAESSRELLIARAADWLESAGVEIPKKADGSADCVIEIAAGFALNKEEVKSKADSVPAIGSGDKVYLD